MAETVEARALKIAAAVMVEVGLCRYDDKSKCRRAWGGRVSCEDCVRKWLMSKARKELTHG